ncbi:MAG: DUF4347 domain-containing protein [Methylobacter sp.]
MKFIKTMLLEKTGKINSSLSTSAFPMAEPDRLHAPRRTLMALEPRIMFDGAAVATADAALPDVKPVATDNAAKDNPQALLDAAAHTPPVEAQTADPAKDNGKLEVAFVDTSVANWSALVSGIEANRPGMAVELIAGGQSGLAQMAAWAQTHSGYDAIHILSPGDQGQMQLGADRLTDAGLTGASAQTELAQIGQALKTGGEIFLYGSNIGAGDSGQAFLRDLSAETGVTVTAADHVVGNADLGGSWTLNDAIGTTSPLAVPGYLGSLGIGEQYRDHSPEALQIQAADPSLDGAKREVAFIDTSAAGWQNVVVDIQTSRPGIEIELIDGTQSGLSQIVAWTHSHKGYDAVHVLSQGSEGVLKLGTDTLADASLGNTEVRIDLRVIGSSLKAGGELLFYASNIGDGSDGQKFLADLAATSGVSVAAPGDSAIALDAAGTHLTLTSAAAPIQPADTANAKSVVVVDATVADWRTLIAGMDPTIPVIVLMPNADGYGELAELAAALSSFHNLDSIHLVTEGRTGGIILGQEALWSGDLQYATADIQAIRDALNPGGDLLLYGCSVAGSDAGKQFIDQLASALGKDINVAASIDKTGPTELGGDWDLEYASGTIDSVLPFTLQGMQDISHCLGCSVSSTSTTTAQGYGSGAAADRTGPSIIGGDNVTAVGAKVGSGYYDFTYGSDPGGTVGYWTTLASFEAAHPVQCAAANAAPTLDASKTPVFTAVNQSTATSTPSGAVGTLVSSLVDIGGSLSNVTDGDSSPSTGIALTATNTTNGTWYYTTNGGTTWTGVGTVSGTQSLLLKADANTRLYFQANSGFNGTVSSAVTFRAWDQTSGTAGAKVDTSSNGGSTAFSSATDTANITVTDNVAPTASVTTATVNNSTSVTTAQSSETGTIYLVKTSVTVTDKTSLDNAVSGGNAKSATVTTANQNTTISTTGLVDGTYKVYSVDAANNVSAASTNSITLDSTAPTAATPVRADFSGPTGTSFTFTIDYSDTGAGMNTGTYGTGNVTVKDPSNNSLTVTGASASGNTVTYTVTPPGGSWDSADAGTYTIAINANSVKDLAGNAVAANATAKTFTASFNTPPSVTTPTAIAYTDTAANDSFSNTTGTLSATDADGIASYGISSPTSTNANFTDGSITYDISKTGTYGTLYVKSTTGEYVYVPSNSAINAISTNQSETFTVTATDSNASPATGNATLTVNITGANDKPVVSVTSAAASSGAALSLSSIKSTAAAVFSAATVSDLDNANFNGGYLRITYSAGGDSYDQLSVYNQGSSASQIGYNSVTGAVSYGGTQIGTVDSTDNGANGAALQITLNGNATKAAVEALLANIRYAHSADSAAATRTLSVTLNDGSDSGTAATADLYVNDNVAPTVTSVSSTTANGSYKAGATVTVTVQFSEIVNVAGGTPQLKLETGTIDQTVNYNGTGSGTNTLSFDYVVQAGDTSSDLDYYDTAALTLNSSTIKDANNNDATLTLSSPGASGSLGNSKNIVIDTTAPNAPAITGITSDTGGVNNDGVTNDQTLVLSGTAEANATVKVYKDSVLLGSTTANGSGNWSYDYTGVTLSEGSYSFTATATDAAGNTGNASSGFAVTIDKTVPVLTLDGGSLSYTEKDAATAISSGATLTEAGTPGKSVLTVQITANNEAADKLSLPTGTGTGINVNGTDLRSGTTNIGTVTTDNVTNGTTWTITFLAGATQQNIQDTIAAIRYNNTSSNPGTSNRTVTFSLTDGAGNNASATRTVAVTAVNDAPTNVALSASRVSTFDSGNATVGTLTATDVDNTTWTYSIVSVTGPSGSVTNTNGAVFDLGTTNSSSTAGAVASATLRAVSPSTLAVGTYTVRIQADDGGTGGTYQKDLTVTVDSSLVVDVTAIDGNAPTGVYATDSTDNGGLDLKEALNFANNASGSITILFAPTLSGTITLPGNLTVRDGVTLKMDSDTDARALTITANGFILAGALTVDVGTGDTLTINSSLTDNGTDTSSLTKTGAGTLVLGGTNVTYSSGNPVATSLNNVTVSAGKLQVTNGGNLGGGTVTLQNGATLAATGTGNFTISNAFALGTGGGTIEYGNTGGTDNVQMSGAISGAGKLTKTGAGVLTLGNTAGNNGWTGDFEVAGGKVFLADQSWNTGTVSGNYGNIIFDTGTTLVVSDLGANMTIANPVTVNGSVTIDAATDSWKLIFSGTLTGANTPSLTLPTSGTVELSGSNSFDGSVTATNAKLVLSSATAISNTSAVTLNANGKLQVTVDKTIGNLSSSQTTSQVLIDKTKTLTVNEASDTTFAGKITNGSGSFGGGNLAKAGTGKLTLTGTTSDYGGTTTISAGTLSISGGTAIPNTSAVTVNTGATLDLAGNETIGSLTGAGNVTLGANTLTAGGDSTSTEFSGVISGTGGLIKTGSGTMTLSGNNSYTGATTVSDGTLTLNRSGGAIADSSAVTVNSPGTLTLSLDDTIGPLSGTGTVSLGSGTKLTVKEITGTDTTFSGKITGSGSVEVSGGGTGTLTLSGTTSDYTGVTRLSSGGKLKVSGGSAIPDTSQLIVNNGTFTLLASEAIGSLSCVNDPAPSANVQLGSYTLTMGGNNTSTSFAGVIAGTGNLVKTGTGTLTLAGVNTYTGTTTVSAGTLAISSDSTPTAGVLNGSSASGVTVSSGATLAGSGTINSEVFVDDGATLSPGIAGTNGGVGKLTVVGNLRINGTLVTDIKGATIAGTDYDQVAVTGAVTLNGGPLTVNLAYTPVLNDTYVLIDNDGSDDIGGTPGTFSNLAEGARTGTLQASYKTTVNGTGNDFTLTMSNQSPVLGGTFTTAGAINDNKTIVPFSGVTVTDAENDNVSITITYTAANGTLAGTGLSGTVGNYTLTAASPATVQSNLRGLVFTPTVNQVAVGAATVTTFTLTPNDGNSNGTSNATTVVTVTSINDAPSFSKGADQVVNENAGVQTVSGWASNLNKGATNESGQTLSFSVSNDNNALFSVQPSIDGNGNLTYTPAANASGTATVTVTLKDSGGTANGGSDTSASQTFTITVNPVNDAPSFTKGADQIVNEDAGAQTVNGWASNLNKGAANESSQTLSFITSNDNNALFSVQPSIDSNGNLTYTPAADASGTTTVTVTLKDDGGTANGGKDTSASQTFTITVNPVNDAPSFTKGADQVVFKPVGAQTVNGWATGLSKGPADESGQTLSFIVSNDNNALFSVQPSIDSNGNLTYTPVENVNGTATVTVTLKDSGGTANGGKDTSTSQTFTITLISSNVAPSFSKGGDQTVNEDAGPQTVAGWATNLSKGPANESEQTLSFIVSNDNNALFSSQPSIDSNGNLTYTPAANANGKATVTVTLKDSGGTANGGKDTSISQTFTITVNPVNDAPTGQVTISGTPTVGSTLLAGNTLADVDGMGPVTYQWQADGVDISGATGGSYTLTEADKGKAISVVARYTDQQGTATTVTSGATAVVTVLNTNLTQQTGNVDNRNNVDSGSGRTSSTGGTSTSSGLGSGSGGTGVGGTGSPIVTGGQGGAGGLGGGLSGGLGSGGGLGGSGLGGTFSGSGGFGGSSSGFGGEGQGGSSGGFGSGGLGGSFGGSGTGGTGSSSGSGSTQTMVMDMKLTTDSSGSGTSGGTINMPSSAFAGLNTAGQITITATQSNGQSLPSFITVNPSTGAVTVKEGAVVSNPVTVKVTIKDSQGKNVVVLVKVQPQNNRTQGQGSSQGQGQGQNRGQGEQPNGGEGNQQPGGNQRTELDQADHRLAHAGKYGLTQQLQMAGRKGFDFHRQKLLDSLADLVKSDQDAA